MRTLEVALALALTAAPAAAFDPNRFASEDDAGALLRYGYQAWKDGDKAEAVDAFSFAAGRGDVAAQWKLARMYQTGDGVAQDDGAAYENFRAIADKFGSRIAPPAQRAFVRYALSALGRYAMDGIQDSRPPSPRLAERYLYRAAALYGDTASQYRLGVLYEDASYRFDRPRLAARWLNLAAASGHARAKFRLGRMFAEGRGVRENRVRGLAMMASAAAQLHARQVEIAGPAETFVDAYATATPAARAAFRDWLSESGVALPPPVETALASSNG